MTILTFSGSGSLKKRKRNVGLANGRQDPSIARSEKTYGAAFCASLALLAGSRNNKHSMTGSGGNSEFCFPETLDFASGTD